MKLDKDELTYLIELMDGCLIGALNVDPEVRKLEDKLKAELAKLTS